MVFGTIRIYAPKPFVDGLQISNRVEHLSGDVSPSPGRLKKVHLPSCANGVVETTSACFTHVRQGIPASRDSRCNLNCAPVGELFSNLIRVVSSFWSQASRPMSSTLRTNAFLACNNEFLSRLWLTLNNRCLTKTSR